MGKNKQGFTIIELIIVIVVIAVLASISLVAFTNIQSRARDAARDVAADQVIKAYQLWMVRAGTDPGQTGYGWSASTTPGTGTGQGFTFFNYQTNGNTANLFIDEGLLPSDFLTATPRNTGYGGTPSAMHAFMTYPCVGGQRWALYYHLENTSTTTDSDYQAKERECRNAPTLDAFSEIKYATYKMRRIKFIE